MGWMDLLQTVDETIVLPWISGRSIQSKERTWKLHGPLPPEEGWHRFHLDGRKAFWQSEADASEATIDFYQYGYLVGDHLVPDEVRVDPNPGALRGASERVFLIEPGIERFVRVQAGRAHEGGPLVYLYQAMPTGAEFEVMNAYLDRLATTNGIRGVVPALDAAFRLESQYRLDVEKRREEIERLAREEAERQRQEEIRRELFRQSGDAAGRRQLAKVDFDAAARAALRVTGAEFLEARDGYQRTEKVVRFRFRGHRFECTCHKDTMQIIDAGICLTAGGVRGDAFFTLESLPSVIATAIEDDVLVILRHVR